MILTLTLVISVLFGCLFLIQLTWYVYKSYRTRDIYFLKGDWPWIGHLLQLKDKKAWEKRKLELLQKYGIFGYFQLSSPMVVTNRVEIWEDLLSSQKYIDKGAGYWVVSKMLGNGLVTSKGELWKKRRKMITPAFHFDILNHFISVMENKTFDFIEYLQKGTSGGEHSLDIMKFAKPFSMSIICDTAMGLDHSIEEINMGPFKRKYERTTNLLYRRLINPLYRYDWLYSFSNQGKEFSRGQKYMSGFVREVIESRIKVRNQAKESSITAPKRRIFIDVMLDAYEKGEIDVEGILDEVNTFVNAGYETTSTALAWTLYCLGRNQRVQEKLYQELVQSEKIEFTQVQDFKSLIYLDLVIKETMRLYSTVPAVGRSIPDGTVLGGVTFPACTLVVSIQSMNRNPDVWENPMEFIPERFEDFEENKRSAFTYIPFSAGPRNCIGQRFAMLELKIALYHLIRTFRVTSSQKESDLKETFFVTHGCEGGLFISLEKRP